MTIQAEEGSALQRRVDECIVLHKAQGGAGEARAAPFDVEAEAEEVREGFEPTLTLSLTLT